MPEPIPAHIHRFILTSVDSVPHLEATLLLRQSDTPWSAALLAQSLFVSEKKAAAILEDLLAAGIAALVTEGVYRYTPASPQLAELLDELSQIYSRNVVHISQLIHSKTDKQARTFGDAFKWKKD